MSQLVTFHNVSITISIGDTEPASNAYTQLCSGIGSIDEPVEWTTDTYSIAYCDGDGAALGEPTEERSTSELYPQDDETQTAVG